MLFYTSLTYIIHLVYYATHINNNYYMTDVMHAWADFN